MRRRGRTAVAILIAMAMVLALVVSLIAVTTGSAGAHAEVVRSAPRPQQIVGGVVDRVEIEFRSPIRAYEGNEMRLTDPSGQSIPVPVTLHGNSARGRFPQLTEPGDYQLFWGLVDERDGDWSTGQFGFTYNPNADEPQWVIGNSGGGGSGVGGVVLLVVVSVVAVALGGWLFFPRLRGRASGGRRKRR